MIKTLKHFFLLFVFMFSMVSAESKEDPYRLYVTMVDPEFHCFALSNNMVFNIPKKNWETTALPEVGTEVHVEPYIRTLEGRSSYNTGELVVFSHDHKKAFIVWMAEGSEQYCLSYVSSESVCIQPAGWVARGVYKNVLTLSDGSKWMLEKDAKVEFTPGDRIIVSKIREDVYMIIDIDRGIFFDKGNFHSGQTVTFYKYVKAKPYVPVEIAQE